VSIYDVACKSFSKEILDKKNYDEKILTTEEDMKNYFSSFSKESAAAGGGGDNRNNQTNSNKFTAKRIYKNYMDDPRNTGKTTRAID
jgi:hypothetical protein